MRKRQGTLARIIRDNRLTNSEAALAKRIVKAILNQRLRGKSRKIIRAIEKKRKEIRRLIANYSDVLDLLEDCEDRTLDFGPSANGASLDYVELQFPHPDFKATYYMFGIAFTTSLTKPKKGSGVLCLAAEKPRLIGDAGVFS